MKVLISKQADTFTNLITDIDNKFAVVASNIASLTATMKARPAFIPSQPSQPETTSTPVTTRGKINPASLRTAITFAQALNSVKTASEAIKIVNIIGKADQETAHIAATIKSDNICTDKKILAVKQKGKINFTFKFATAESADEVGNLLKAKYKNNVVINTSNAFQPPSESYPTVY